jgi:hypothetical protein
MTAKTTRKTRKSQEATYSDMLATCVRASKNIDSLNKSLTKLIDSKDSIIDLWSFEGEPHDIAIGSRVLLRVKHMPDGKVFYNAQ